MINKIYIEITNKCNLSCSFCPKSKRDLKEMSLTNFEYLIKQVKNITDYIYLHVKGEPMLHSQFNEILNICDSYNMKVQLTTNGTFLSKYNDILKHSSIRKISISIHAYDEINFNLDLLLNNITNLIINLNKYQFLELRFWNKDALGHNTTYVINKLKEKYEFMETKKPLSYKLTNNTYLHFEYRFQWPKLATSNTNVGRCNGVKHMLAILVDGSVTPCCLDDDCSIYLGNVFEKNILDLLDNYRYKTMITNLNNGYLVEKLCQNCTYKYRFNKEKK